MKLIFLLIALVTSVAALAQTTTGPARVIDGDTIELGVERFRLKGVDAPESQQTCNRDGVAWPCGKDAAAHLANLVEGRVIRCDQSDIDIYGRIVAICRAGAMDLGQALVDAGLAVTLPNAPLSYSESEALRRDHKVGLWGSIFDQPSAYRAANPQQFRAVKREPSSRSMNGRANSPFPTSPPYRAQGVLYRNCAEARAAGAAPIYRGQPGYRPEMDGDGDGIACEPYRGRR